MKAFLKSKTIIVNCLILMTFLTTFLVVEAQENPVIQNEELGTKTTSTVPGKDPEIPPVQTVPQQNLRPERTGSLNEVRQARILNLAANISNRMEAAITRLINITKRLNSRIEKQTALGINTNAATNKLVEANNLLTQASINLSNIDTLVYNATTSSEPRSSWQNVRTVYTETAQLIRRAHLALRDTIALLKNPTANNDQSTTTESTSTTTETTE